MHNRRSWHLAPSPQKTPTATSKHQLCPLLPNKMTGTQQPVPFLVRVSHFEMVVMLAANPLRPLQCPQRFVCSMEATTSQTCGLDGPCNGGNLQRHMYLNSQEPSPAWPLVQLLMSPTIKPKVSPVLYAYKILQFMTTFSVPLGSTKGPQRSHSHKQRHESPTQWVGMPVLLKLCLSQSPQLLPRADQNHQVNVILLTQPHTTQQSV
jgi:hypothetical protein